MADPAAATVPSLSDSLTGYQAGLQKHTADTEKELDVAKGAYADRVKKIDTEEAALNPDQLKPPTLAPPPNPKVTQPIEVWGSAAMWVAALGGMLTRRPLTNSLNAAAAVMSAYRQMDSNAAQSAFDVWKVENENAIKMAQFSVDSYKTALARIQEDRKGAMNDFMVTAKALGDENAAWVAQHYGIDGAVRYTDAFTNHLDRMEKAGPEIEMKHMQLQNLFDIKRARDDLAKAQKLPEGANKQEAIAAAQAELGVAMQQQRDLAAELHPFSGGRSGSSAEITYLKDKFDKSVATYNTVLKNLPGPGHDKEVKDAKKAMDDAERAYKDAADASTEGGAAAPTAKPAAKELLQKAWIAINKNHHPKAEVRKAFLKDGGTEADFDRTFGK